MLTCDSLLAVLMLHIKTNPNPGMPEYRSPPESAAFYRSPPRKWQLKLQKPIIYVFQD